MGGITTKFRLDFLLYLTIAIFPSILSVPNPAIFPSMFSFNITKSNFFKLDNRSYNELKLEIEERAINKILFVIDADYKQNDSKYGGYDNSKKELEKIIKELELKEISDIYITCDPDNQCGYLESLILSTIPPKQKDCIEDFLECSEFKSKENHKAILNQIYKMGYPNAPYDFSHLNFNKLKTKLKKLFEEEI